jgi:arylsulfatase A-like enzyme
MYDRWRNDFSSDKQRNYFDNFELMDRTVGAIRAALENAQMWDSTTILITGDHGWRPTVWRGKWGLLAEEEAFADRTDHRVPFILKMAGQTEPLAYDSPFNTVLSHDLVLALLRGEASDPEDVVTWIEQRRSSGEVALTPSPICGPLHQWYGSPPPELRCE